MNDGYTLTRGQKGKTHRLTPDALRENVRNGRKILVAISRRRPDSTLVAAFGYLNCRFFRLPEPVGITAVSLAVSLAVAIFGMIDPDIVAWARGLMKGLDFSEVVFQGMLGLLLFAGSLHVNWSDLRRERWAILALASIGVALSAAIVGVLFYVAAQWLGFGLPFLHCLLFGALIAPTDPIAVMGVLRSLGASKSLEARIAGESLFNDGTGIVVFLTLLGIATGAGEPSAAGISLLLVAQVIGGLLVGFGVGLVGFYLLRGIDSYAVETLITLAMATAGYAFADVLHASAPIAVVIMGLIVGNHGKRNAMSADTRARLFDFWQLADKLRT